MILYRLHKGRMKPSGVGRWVKDSEVHEAIARRLVVVETERDQYKQRWQQMRAEKDESIGKMWAILGDCNTHGFKKDIFDHLRGIIEQHARAVRDVIAIDKELQKLKNRSRGDRKRRR